MHRKKLIFVYNADSGKLNLAFDIAHKILSPSTYQCDLCALSHGYFQMHASWKAFIKELGLEVEYLHRDEYPASAPAAGFPLILLEENNQQAIFMSREAISACDSAELLQQAIRTKLSI